MPSPTVTHVAVAPGAGAASSRLRPLMVPAPYSCRQVTQTLACGRRISRVQTLYGEVQSRHPPHAHRRPVLTRVGGRTTRHLMGCRETPCASW